MHGWEEIEIGRTRRGLPLVAFVGGRAHGPAIDGLLLAALHGEEPETLQVARRVLERVRGAASGWIVVPCANPDGVVAGTRQNGAGVDLNRNFPASSWSPEPSFTYPPGTAVRRRPYRTNRSSPGAAAGSEPEVQAVLALVARHDPALVVDLHAPLALIAPTPGVSDATVAALAAASGLPVHPSIGSPTPGALRDWCAGTGRPCVTYEVEHAPLPALLARHVPAIAALVAGADAPAPPPWAAPLALRHRGRPVAHVAERDGAAGARVVAEDAPLLALAARATVLARLAAAIPDDLPDAEADARLEEARAAAGLAWNEFRDLQGGWEVVLDDGSVRPVAGAVHVDGARATWEW